MKKIDKNVDTSEKNVFIEEKNPRRNFLKKAAYSAPVVLVLGQLAKPTKACADSGDPSGPPAWGGF